MHILSSHIRWSLSLTLHWRSLYPTTCGHVGDHIHVVGCENINQWNKLTLVVLQTVMILIYMKKLILITNFSQFSSDPNIHKMADCLQLGHVPYLDLVLNRSCIFAAGAATVSKWWNSKLFCQFIKFNWPCSLSRYGTHCK